MPAEKLSMKKIREALRLYHEGLGYRIISSSTGIGLGSVSHYIKRAKECGLTLVGFARTNSYVVYSHPQQLDSETEDIRQ